VPTNQILHVDFFLLEFLCLNLKFLKIFFYVVCLLGFLFDHFAATGDSGSEVVDVAFVHFALALMIFLAFDVLIEVLIEHLNG
jgi:uncharacterized membrane-anchored protein